MFRTVPIFFLIVLMVVGCTPPERPPIEDANESAAPIPVTAEGVLAARPELDIGDVEQTIHFNMTLASRSRGPNVAVESRLDGMDRIRLTTITIEPPFPEELWFDVVLQSRNQFDAFPVVLRGDYVVNDETPVGQVRYVLGENSFRDHSLGSIEVMQALDPVPESALLSLDVEAFLMAQGTNPDVLNPDTASAPPERRSTAITFNPVRIEFVGAGETPEPVEEHPDDEEEYDAVVEDDDQ